MTRYLLAATALSVSLLGLPHAAYADEANDAITARISVMEQEIALLKRQLEVKEEKEKAAAEKSANMELGRKGFKVTSPDKFYELSLNGYFQLDGRQFMNDDANTGKDDLLARRLRPILQAKAGDASFRLMPDFAGSTTRVFDAHADYKFTDALQVRAGKFKTPIGLERLQSASDMLFIERGHPTNLAPSRDFGVMLYGNPVPDVLEYQLGIFNGNADLGNTDGDDDDKKDVAGRFFVHPFRNSDVVSLQGFGVGAGGSIGDREGDTTSRILGTYKTPGQQDFFKYRSDTFAEGTHWRAYPQAYWYSGNKGLLGEYAISNQEVTRGANHEELQHHAWQIEGSYVLTGEDVNFKGGVKPEQDFSLSGEGIGAFEAVARVGATDVDDDTFLNFADPDAAASKAQTYGAGLNWYLNENLKVAANYEYTTFEGGAAGGEDREDEQVLLSRVQFRF